MKIIKEVLIPGRGLVVVVDRENDRFIVGDTFKYKGADWTIGGIDMQGSNPNIVGLVLKPIPAEPHTVSAIAAYPPAEHIEIKAEISSVAEATNTSEDFFIDVTNKKGIEFVRADGNDRYVARLPEGMSIPFGQVFLFQGCRYRCTSLHQTLMPGKHVSMAKVDSESERVDQLARWLWMIQNAKCEYADTEGSTQYVMWMNVDSTLRATLRHQAELLYDRMKVSNWLIGK